MLAVNVHNQASFRARPSAPALLCAVFLLFSLLYFRAHGVEEPEYEPRAQVQSNSWLGHVLRFEKAWIKSAMEVVLTFYFHSPVITAVHQVPGGVYLFGSWLIRAPPMLSPL